MNYTYYRRYQPRKKKSSFKSFFWLVVFLVLITLFCKACVGFVMDLAEEKRDEAILSVNRGEAEVLLWGQNDWQSTADSQIILEGDSVRTSEGSTVTLALHNGTELRIDENTHLVFSEVLVEGDDDFVMIELKDGRVWLEQIAKEKGQMELTVQTDVLNVISLQGSFLISNLVDDEYLYVLDGQATVEFADRTAGSIIEEVVVEEGNKVAMSDARQRQLLNREDILLFEEYMDELAVDEFVMWNVGTWSYTVESEPEDEPVEEEPEPEEDEIEETSEPEEVTPEEPEPEPELEEEPEVTEELKISISSPLNGVTITETEIAIEGVIAAGYADEVYVTWSGNGLQVLGMWLTQII
jgi:hypothetical protein